ncbi:short transient receptor potential channel 3-like [Paramuricea clavata]|uniref:Short transient receptor potential channel 3-like n=1 Tax=Paramuricea clavata TaxID=317549 RepID=A0A6S7HBH3_PARCT|nr:short transient receptor potential channel 3-like [Paramuricea clavata]
MENFETTHPRFKITSETGKFLFAIYLITAVLVGINMLIAMMNSSFEYVAEDKQCLNWNMSRTAMWLEFADNDEYLLPPPYNILHYPVQVCMRKWKAEEKEKSKDPAEKMEMNKVDDPGREGILQKIVNRYLENDTKE